MSEFCQFCSNLYNYKLTESGDLVYYCELCGNQDNQINHCITINEVNRNARDYLVNKNLVYDYTLPRTRKIICPKCHKNTEIIIFQYNPDMLNVGYMCTECRNYWKN